MLCGPYSPLYDMYPGSYKLPVNADHYMDGRSMP
jgi:hypothetical protein